MERVGKASSAIYGGVVDGDDLASDAVVALRVGDGSPFELCTGTLVAPNLVLTARHCISRNIAEEIDCDEKGVSRNGDQVAEDVAPRTIHVLTGKSPEFSATPAANGKIIFRPTGQTICNTDIALVVLDRPVKGVAPAHIRLDGDVRPGETIRAVGYGKNDQSARLGTRFRREGLPVLGVGPMPRKSSAGRPALAPSEFEIGRSICQGDSGGPAISEETGAIIGVVSRGVDCNLDFGHIYTKTIGFGTLFKQAFDAAGASPLPEEGYATWQSAAAGGDTLALLNGQGDASSTPKASGGCSAAPHAPATGLGAFAFAGLFVGLTLRRRRAAR